jgi:hypothetical protein
VDQSPRAQTGNGDMNGAKASMASIGCLHLETEPGKITNLKYFSAPNGSEDPYQILFAPN